MILFDDLEASEKIKVYDRGVSVDPSPENLYQMLVGYRAGDVWSPHLGLREALNAGTAHFLECITKNLAPRTGGPSGLHVVRLLEAATESMANQGRPVTLPRGVAVA